MIPMFVLNKISSFQVFKKKDIFSLVSIFFTQMYDTFFPAWNSVPCTENYFLFFVFLSQFLFLKNKISTRDFASF